MIYLDNAATTYRKPMAVKNAINSFLECGNAGRGSHKLSVAASDVIYKTREKALDFFRGSHHNVIFTNNATTSLNYAIQGICKNGWRIITSDFEHNSVRRPLLYLEREKNCSITKVETGNKDILLRQLTEKLKKGADAVICIHKSNVTGRTLPVREIGCICKKYGAVFIVDASQSAGNTDICMDRDNIDILCTAGHKALYGPQGTGIMIVSDDIRLNPLIFGGSGSNSFDEDMPDFYPDSHEAGTLSCPLIAGLGAGISFVESVGVREIEYRENKLFSLCRDMLDRRGITVYDKEFEGANLLFNIRNMSAEEVANRLDRVGICVRSGFHCSPDAHKTLGTGESGAVRASFSYFTSEREAYFFCREVLNLAK